jgi:hypothetical protein
MHPVLRTFVAPLALVAFAGAARGAEPKLEAAVADADLRAASRMRAMPCEGPAQAGTR